MTSTAFRLGLTIGGLVSAGLAIAILAPVPHDLPSAMCLPVSQDMSPKADMVWIPGGMTVLGSDRYLPEERPRRQVQVDGFWISSHAVTNGEFQRFVAATGYKTLAERDHQGGAVFRPAGQMINMADMTDWWTLDPDASWRRPDGAGSSIRGHSNDPVVQVVYADARAYAEWRGQDLPSEAEWERAARGGIADADFVWGAKQEPGAKPLANIWQGTFPLEDRGEDGFKSRAPVGCFPSNGYGLYDMVGNVWQIVGDPWAPKANPKSSSHVVKGGSYLCADNYCLRYRPAARQPGDDTLGTSHIGFRTVWRGPAPKP